MYGLLKMMYFFYNEYTFFNIDKQYTDDDVLCKSYSTSNITTANVSTIPWLDTKNNVLSISMV